MRLLLQITAKKGARGGESERKSTVPNLSYYFHRQSTESGTELFLWKQMEQHSFSERKSTAQIDRTLSLETAGTALFL